MKNKKPPNDLIREPFPGDQDKPIKSSGKELIFFIPLLPLAGLCWLLGIRELSAIAIIAFFCSLALDALLYYLFFTEPGFFTNTFREFFKGRNR